MKAHLTFPSFGRPPVRRNAPCHRAIPIVLAALAAVLVISGCDDTSPISPHTKPSFSGTVADQTYTVGKPISTLSLPAATGGNGLLTYTLEPSVPGLIFDHSTRTLSGTPTTSGTYPMTYTVAHDDDNISAPDEATLPFTITVEERDSGDAALMEVIDTQDAAADIFNEIVTGGDSLEERLQALALRLTALPQVTDAEVLMDAIEVSYESGLRSLMLFVDAQSAEPRRGPQGQSASAPAATPADSRTALLRGVNLSLAQDDAAVIGNSRVLICAPLDNHVHLGHPEVGPRLNEIFSAHRFGSPGAGFVVSLPDFLPVAYLPDTKCTVEDLLKMHEYGTIILSGHGVVSEGSQYFFLSVPLERGEGLDAFQERHDKLLNDNSLVISTTYWFGIEWDIFERKTTVAITDRFIDNLPERLPNSVVFADTCQGAKSPLIMANSFLQKGARAYLGFDQTIASRYGTRTAISFFDYLTYPGTTVGDAFALVDPKVDPHWSELSDAHRPPTAARFEILGSYGAKFKYSSRPTFGGQRVNDQTYKLGTGVPPLILPEAEGFDGELHYALGGERGIPKGMDFSVDNRTLTGTPEEPGIYEMTWEVWDSDIDESEGDTDSLTFSIKVEGHIVPVPESIAGWSLSRPCCTDTVFIDESKILKPYLDWCGTYSYTKTGDRTAEIHTVTRRYVPGIWNCDVRNHIRLQFHPETLHYNSVWTQSSPECQGADGTSGPIPEDSDWYYLAFMRRLSENSLESYREEYREIAASPPEEPIGGYYSDLYLRDRCP